MNPLIKKVIYAVVGLWITSSVFRKKEDYKGEADIDEPYVTYVNDKTTNLFIQQAKSNNLIYYINQTAPKFRVDPYIMAAIALVESGGDTGAVGDNGASLGAFQLQKAAVTDVNDVYSDTLGEYKHSDAYNAFKGALLAAAYVSIIKQRFELTNSQIGEIGRRYNQYSYERSETATANANKYATDLEAAYSKLVQSGIYSSGE